MRRQCYGSSDAIDQMHHASRSFPIPLSPPPRERSRNGPIARPARRPSPQQDSESEKGGNNARKRINVAVTASPQHELCNADILSSVLAAAKGKSDAAAIRELAYAKIAKMLAPRTASS